MADAHKLFNTRLENIYDVINLAARLTPDVKAACDACRERIHPHLLTRVT